MSACAGTSNVCLERDILCLKCVDSVECNLEATKMSAETQLTHHKGVNWVTAEVAVMKGHADETKPGIFSDPVVHDTIVDTCENEDFRFKQEFIIYIYICTTLEVKIKAPHRGI